jgi:hypothetical protein
MKPPATKAVAAAVVWAAAVGCGGGSGSQPMMCFGASVVANERNDYAFSSTITLSTVTVAPMTNLSFAWGGLTKDFLGHPLSPTTDLGAAILAIWALPLHDFETKLNADALFTADLVVSPPLNLPITNGATTGNLYDFLINGTALSPAMFNQYFDASLYTPANSTFMFGVQAGTDLGRQIRMLKALNLDASSTVTNVSLTDDSTTLKYTANLHTLTITGVPGGTPALMLDWSQMTTNALGRTFTTGAVTDAVVGHYSETPVELETQFLDLDRIAIATYRAQIAAGSVLDFTTLVDENGASFPGIDGTGTWLVGLTCGGCRNPAPWYMTILKPCSM